MFPLYFLKEIEREFENLIILILPLYFLKEIGRKFGKSEDFDVSLAKVRMGKQWFGCGRLARHSPKHWFSGKNSDGGGWGMVSGRPKNGKHGDGGMV